MQIAIQPALPTERRPRPQDERQLGFGRIYSDHMFSMCWSEQNGWREARVEPYHNLSLAPSALALHYGQMIFEGFKAYLNPHGGVNLFRPQQHIARFNRSARRLNLPEVDEAFLLGAVEHLLAIDHDWVPRSAGASLYIRPTMIATEPYIGLKSSAEALLFVISGPVGAYYPEGFDPVRIRVCEKYSRSGPNGLGNAKTAANYAASILAEKEARAEGYTQVLWLDACQRRYIEEVGAMNIFFKINGRVLTPALSSSILAGVTRDSVLQLLRHWGEAAEETRLSIDEVLQAHEQGQLEEVFGSGTAAVISPVGMLSYGDRALQIGDGSAGELASRLFDTLTGIQYGLHEDPFGWVHEVRMSKASLPCADA